MTRLEAPAFGLNAPALALVREVLERHPEVREACVFGSRAQGRHRPESDVDLALYGELDERLVARIAGELDELPLPYSFDVVSYTGLRHGPLQEHIERVGRRIFQRSS